MKLYDFVLIFLESDKSNVSEKDKVKIIKLLVDYLEKPVSIKEIYEELKAEYEYDFADMD